MSKLRADLLDYAKKEIQLTGWQHKTGESKGKDKELVCKNVLDLVDVFSKAGHSAVTAAYARDMFHRLTRCLPIMPLTGEDDEWELWVDGMHYQNKRCRSIYKYGKDGQAYDNAAAFFWKWVERELGESEPGYPGTVVKQEYFTTGDSARNITFPYVVKDEPEYVFVPTDKFPNEVR